MRSIWVGLLVLAGLCAGLVGLRSEGANRKPPTRAVKAQAETPPDREEDIVKGYGLDAVAARERALEKAQERVRQQLAEKPRLLEFRGLRSCVKQLAGRKHWCPTCDRLENQIVAVMRGWFELEPHAQETALIVR